jgi:hypothetical protein
METLPSDEVDLRFSSSADNPSTADEEDFEHVHRADDDTDDPWHPHLVSRTPSVDGDAVLPSSSGILILPSRTPSLQSNNNNNEAVFGGGDGGPLLSLPGESLATDIDSLREALLGSLAGDSHHSELDNHHGGGHHSKDGRRSLLGLLVLAVLGLVAVGSTAALLYERRTWRHANAALAHQVHELQADWRSLVARVSQDHEAQAAALQASLARQVAAQTRQLEALWKQEQDLKVMQETKDKLQQKKTEKAEQVQQEKDRLALKKNKKAKERKQAEEKAKARQKRAKDEARETSQKFGIPYGAQEEAPHRAPTTSPYTSGYRAGGGGAGQKPWRTTRTKATFDKAWRQAESTLTEWTDATQHTLRTFLDDFTDKAWKAHILIFAQVDLTYHQVRLKFTEMWQAFNASLHEPQEESPQFWQPIMLSATVVVAAAALTEGVSRWWSALVPPEECHAGAGCGHNKR